MAERMLPVRMRYQISGSRHDGRPWPPGGGTIEVPEWEFRDLLRGGHADPHGREADEAWAAMRELPERGRPSKIDPPEPAEPAGGGEAEAAGEEMTEPVPEPLVAGAVAAEGKAGEADQQDSAGAAEPAEPPRVPGPAAVKQEWIDYAISQGADPDKAAAMTKADLMSRYGGRL